MLINTDKGTQLKDIENKIQSLIETGSDQYMMETADSN